MIEAVGERYWPALLPDAGPAAGARRPDRAAGDHDAARADDGHPAHLHLDTKYIFPGGLIPSVTAIEDTLARCTGLRVAERLRLRRALRRRRCGCGGSGSPPGRPTSLALGFDEVFRRMWRLYLGYSEAGFAVVLPGRLPVPAGAWRNDRQRRAAVTARCRAVCGELGARLLPNGSRRPAAGAAAGLGRQRGGPGGRAGRGAAHAPGAAPAAVAPGRARRRPGLRHRRARRRGRPDARCCGWPGRGRPRARPDRVGQRRPGWAAAGAGGRVPGSALLGPPPRPPASEARLRGRLHSRARDRAVIAHHYDLTAAFYQLLLDPQMAYSCACWEPADDPAYTLADAQRDKLDSICRKLGLRPGQRLLDVGCGWGSLTVHAARQYGARVTAVTLSGEQAAFVAGAGRASRPRAVVDGRLQDYREIERRPVRRDRHHRDGRARRRQAVPGVLRTAARGCSADDGRLLIQQMSRGRERAGRRAVHRVLHRAGHAHAAGGRDGRPAGAGRPGGRRTSRRCARTTCGRSGPGWTTSSGTKAEITRADRRRAGPGVAAVPDGGALAFEEGRMGVDQILAVRRQG